MLPKFPRGVPLSFASPSQYCIHFSKGQRHLSVFMSGQRNDYGSKAKWSARYYEDVARCQRVRTPAPTRGPKFLGLGLAEARALKLPFKYICVGELRCYSSALKIALPR